MEAKNGSEGGKILGPAITELDRRELCDLAARLIGALRRREPARNRAGAVAAVFELSRAANRMADENRLSAAAAKAILDACRDFDRVLGALDVDAALAAGAADELPAGALEKAEARAAARKAKNFAESDRLRDELAAMGVAIEDLPGGKYRLSLNK